MFGYLLWSLAAASAGEGPPPVGDTTAAAVVASAPAFAAPEAIDDWLDGVVLLLVGPAWCSGVVIDDQGTIATAYHCVASGQRAKVTTRDGQSGLARTIAAWPSEDLALISAPELAASLPKALPVRAALPPVGTRVYGLGHPYAPLAFRNPQMEGMLLWSVSEGIVSNTGPHLIQTDAALNPGNSGGPVVDSEGGIVGITSRKLGGDNLAFAAASPQLAKLVAEPRPLRWFGGQTWLGSSLFGGLSGEAALCWQVRAGAVVRDRLVASMGLGLPIDAQSLAEQLGSSWYPIYEIAAAGRQRLGRGSWSTTVDLGGTLLLAEETVAVHDEAGAFAYTEPAPLALRGGAMARLGFGGIGLRAVLVPLDGELLWLFGLDADVPGVVGTF